MVTRTVVLATAATLAATASMAQIGPSATLARVTVSAAVADRTLNKYAINADTARALVDTCVAWAKQQPGNNSLAIVVLDPMGYVIDAHQMDGVVPSGNETALMKAKTALYARASTTELGARYGGDDARLIRLWMGEPHGLAFYPVSGGLPIVVEKQLIGAMGVGGSANGDEQCAYQAMQKVLGPQPPLYTPPARSGGAGAAGGRGGRGAQ